MARGDRPDESEDAAAADAAADAALTADAVVDEVVTDDAATEVIDADVVEGEEHVEELDAEAEAVGDVADLLEDEADEQADDTSRVSGWKRVFRGNRTLWIVAGVAVLSLVLGLLVGRFIVSPADAASDAPDPGLITVPVEYGELSNDVTLRGEVGYADAVEVKIDTGDISGPAVVTGQVPAVGAELGPQAVALEIVGRPVIVLPGELPAYRTLRYGVAGPDVQQLKTALSAVGIDPGDMGSNTYDAATADAVRQLYANVGYPAPAPPEGATEGVTGAEEQVRSAERAIADAEAQLAQASRGASAVEIRQADNAVASAKRALDAALAASPQDPVMIADLKDQLELARLQRQQLDASPDTGSAQAAVDSAWGQLESAQGTLQRAREEAMTPLPASEVLYLAPLPRRVDAVDVERGGVLSGTAMTVSGAALELTGSAAEADARLLAVGDRAVFDLPDGNTHGAVIAALEPGKTAADRWSVSFTPDALTAEQTAELQGRNVRVSIPVGATDGAVLSVPLAALTAGPGGESRVEVVEGDPRDGERAKTRLVVVETGLAAGGYVEVTPVDGELAEGELVVIGQ